MGTDVGSSCENSNIFFGGGGGEGMGSGHRVGGSGWM